MHPAIRCDDDFTLTKGLPDADFDPFEWFAESTVDPSNQMAERSERNNLRIDPFRTHPDDPGIPDEAVRQVLNGSMANAHCEM